jgi:hypothetical protein
MEEGRLGFEWEDWAQEEEQEVGMTVEQLQKCGGERSIHSPAELQRGMPPQQELGMER